MRIYVCCLIFQPQMSRMWEILYFFSANDKDLGEAPLKIRVIRVICG